MDTIPETGSKIKGLFARAGERGVWTDLGLILIVFLTALAAFGLGRLSVLDTGKEPLQIFDVDGTQIN